MAKNASAAAEGLCTWVRAMKFYHEASKIVKPKLEALAIAEGQMDAANKVSLHHDTFKTPCVVVFAPIPPVGVASCLRLATQATLTGCLRVLPSFLASSLEKRRR